MEKCEKYRKEICEIVQQLHDEEILRMIWSIARTEYREERVGD